MPVIHYAIENHPQRAAIIDALRAGTPLRTIAGTTSPPVSVMALSRYRAKFLTGTVNFVDSTKAPTSCVSKPWVETEYVAIHSAAMHGKRKDLPSARAALDSICRLNGYDAPKRSESLTMNLHAFRSDQLAGQLSAALHALPEADRRALLAEEPAIEAEILPPGE